MRKYYLYIILCLTLFVGCSYDENIEVQTVTIQLIYPENTIEPYEGAQVELKNAAASIFMTNTDDNGVARFTVPTGVYEITSANTLVTYDFRYICNGVKSNVIIESGKENIIELPLTVTKKRIVH